MEDLQLLMQQFLTVWLRSKASCLSLASPGKDALLLLSPMAEGQLWEQHEYNTGHCHIFLRCIEANSIGAAAIQVGMSLHIVLTALQDSQRCCASTPLLEWQMRLWPCCSTAPTSTS